jgi:NADH dehydrogenase
VSSRQIHAVTGAFGYSGQYIARRLLERGHRVITLTDSPERADPFGGSVQAHRFHFEDPDALVESLRGVRALYNTYWVRFNHRSFRHSDAVTNTLALFSAAQRAGVERVVHVSITNPSEASPFEYFRGKARLERALRESGLSYAILRPAVLFGGSDILINNIAWLLRVLPVFGVFGDGRYRLQPIHVDDLARLAVEQGAERESVVVDAIGPESVRYRGLVEMLGDAIGCRRPIFSAPAPIGRVVAGIAGWWLEDVVITRDEIEGLMADLLCVESPPAGTVRLSGWAREHADSLGRRYASELKRRRDRTSAYTSP